MTLLGMGKLVCIYTQTKHCTPIVSAKMANSHDSDSFKKNSKM